MARRMLPHVFGIMADIPAVWHSAHHSYAEMKMDVVVQCPVILGGVGTKLTVSGVEFL